MRFNGRMRVRVQLTLCEFRWVIEGVTKQKWSLRSMDQHTNDGRSIRKEIKGRRSRSDGYIFMELHIQMDPMAYLWRLPRYEGAARVNRFAR